MTTTFGFYLTGLFIPRLLKAGSPESLPKENVWGLRVQDCLQAGYPVCHPTNKSVKALRELFFSKINSC